MDDIIDCIILHSKRKIEDSALFIVLNNPQFIPVAVFKRSFGHLFFFRRGSFGSCRVLLVTGGSGFDVEAPAWIRVDC